MARPPTKEFFATPEEALGTPPRSVERSRGILPAEVRVLKRTPRVAERMMNPGEYGPVRAGGG